MLTVSNSFMRLAKKRKSTLPLIKVMFISLHSSELVNVSATVFYFVFFLIPVQVKRGKKLTVQITEKMMHHM